MKRLFSTVLLYGCLISSTFAAVSDTAMYTALYRLACELHLREPKLRKNEYEVRIWQREQLVRGAAHIGYVIRKTRKKVQLSRYLIRYANGAPLKFTRSESGQSLDSTFWNRLVAQDILTLPDWETVKRQFEAKPKRDSTRVLVASDNSIMVIGNKSQPRFAIGDGETYYVQVFSTNGRREYSYSNPQSYLGIKPLPELKKIVTILDEVTNAMLFR